MTVNCSQWWCKKEYQMMRQKNIIGIIHKLIMCCVVHFVQKQQQQLRNEKYFPIKINEMAIFFFKDTLGCVRLLQDSNKQIFKSSAQCSYTYFFNFVLAVVCWLFYSIRWMMINSFRYFIRTGTQSTSYGVLVFFYIFTIYNFFILFINISLTGRLGFVDKTSKLL